MKSLQEKLRNSAPRFRLTVECQLRFKNKIIHLIRKISSYFNGNKQIKLKLMEGEISTLAMNKEYIN